MVRWLILIVMLAFLALPASANGAMGLIYGTFSWSYWLLYVAITVLLEAYAFGRWARKPFVEALGISLGANACTGLIGALFSGIFGYMVYGIGARSYVEPNPLVQTIFCLFIGGVISAVIESLFWTKAAGGSSLKVSLLIHLAGIPLALIILLLPARPYDGLEGQANFRRNYVKKAIARAISESIQEDEAKPFYAPGSWDELIKQVQPTLFQQDRTYSNEALQATRFRPHFARFDLGEMGREPCEFNPALIGKDLRKLENPDWLVRWTSNGWFEGIIIEEGGTARHITNLRPWLEKRRR